MAGDAPGAVASRVREIHEEIDDLMARLDEILVQNKTLEQKRIRLLRRIAELKMEAEVIARDCE
ncbi:MAG TPA: hypothetical protein VK473_01480 [Terriglobales bacterium]|nr:hypothetical protein [Terriglobales bacterium]